LVRRTDAMPEILLASEKGWPRTLFMWLVRGIAAFASLYWFLLLLELFGAIAGPRDGSGNGFHYVAPSIRLLAMTPFFLLFVVPALGFSFLGGRDGPKIAAVLLTAGCFLATVFYFIIKG
jgi:hypothetical protein